jgi:cytochrome c556
MRIWSGAVILAVGLGVGCANRSDSASTPPAGGAQAPPPAQAGGGAQTAPAGGAQAGARGGGAGAQAAARVTVEQHEAAMKGIAQANGAMQKNLKGNMLMEAAKDAQQLATLFGEVERFWTQNNKPDAVTLAQTARTGATEVAGAAAAGDQMKALAAAGNIGGTCKQCHGTYRDGAPPGPYSIKPGVVTP